VSEGRSAGQRFRDALEGAVGAAVVDLRLPLRLLAVGLLAVLARVSPTCRPTVA
jgi:hypothetical protein